MNAARLACCIVFAILPVAARGQCVKSEYPVADGVPSIGVYAGTFPSDSAINSGLSKWNNSCPGAGTRFPQLLLGATANINIRVNLVEWSPTDSCGRFQP